MMARLKLSLSGIITAVLILVASVSHAKDEAMLVLANASGCFICHLVAPVSTDDLPLAPSYQEIAIRYKKDTDAFNRLLDRVMHGTVYQDQAWSGKVGMRFMPPNVNISRDTAAALVNWILDLDIDPALAKRLLHHDRMLTLSTVSGCTICHRMDPVTELRVVPLAPSFREIAARYENRANSPHKLLDSVENGTQGNQKVWHNVNMQFMPPNVALKKEDATDLVHWILSLDTKGIPAYDEPPAGRQ
ncbi:MAG: hypothetical protein KZQ86_15180 [Candidatus Thiodiazotropha sp. (ex Lucinoma kastoroae)]|nr:hypothetical protein [Candidatus Thiodiazotropha sp. (ex Lucinoma kastoroae)]